MVRQMLWLFISVMICHAGLAKDPFDKTRRQGTTQATLENTKQHAKFNLPHGAFNHFPANSI